MKRAFILSVFLLTTLTNAPSISAVQEISSDNSNEMNVNFTVNPTYTISIPADINISTPATFNPTERELSNFEVKATDVVMPDGSYVEVLVHIKEEYQNQGKNALVNEDGQYLDFNFGRIDGANYGFTEIEEQDGFSGIWKVAEFHPISSELHTDTAPVSLKTDDILVHSGEYKSTLVFDISLTSNIKEKEIVTTPFTDVDTVETKEFYEGHEGVLQEAQPEIVEIEYEITYKDGIEILRTETNRRTIQEGKNKIIGIGIRTEYDDWLDWVDTLPERYVIANDNDFVESDGKYIYSGTDDYVIIPYRIKGEKPRNYHNMFSGFQFRGDIKGVATNYHDVTSMDFMFLFSQSSDLELAYFTTKNVTSMNAMFVGVKSNLDLKTFDTSEVTDMTEMFSGTSGTLNLESFNTSKVTTMEKMFSGATGNFEVKSFDTNNVMNYSFMFHQTRINLIDLSSFTISSNANTELMFYDALATTGYARTQTDANRLNGSLEKPNALKFVVK